DRPRGRRGRRLRAGRRGRGRAPRQRPRCSSVRPAGRGRRDVRREADHGRPRARLVAAAAGAPGPGPGALAARGCARRAGRPPRDDLEGAARERPPRSGRGAAGGAAADELRRVPPRPQVIAPARRAAYEVVRRVFEDDAYGDRAFSAAAAGLDARDRALAQQLAYGTVQRARTLDHAIDTLGRRPLRKLDPPVRASLRLGAYQLGYLEGVPAWAAANESVELVRAAGLERAVAFTNAVVRRLAEGIRPLLDALPEGPLRHSYPDWVAEVWERDLGRDEAL